MAKPGLLRKLAVHTSHYSAASLLVTTASFFSFPFLTRIFSVADYGIMNLISATLLLLVGLGKLGLQHSIIRFESEVQAGRLAFDRRTFFSTTVLGMAGTGFVVTAAWATLSRVLHGAGLKDPALAGLFALTAVLILIRCLDSCLTNHLRAEQQSRLLMNYQVGLKYAGLVLVVVVLLWVSKSLRGFYLVMIATEGLGVLLLSFLMFGPGRGRPAPSPKFFSTDLFRELLRFGIPMMIGYELSGIILNVGDRYVIEYLMPGDPLGVYAAAYNLCQYVQTICVYSLTQAVMPIYMRLWSEKGEEETSRFIGRVLHYYVLLAAPVVAGMAAVGPELLPFVASEKYGPGAAIIPYVMAGMVIDGANVVVGAGLFIHKGARTIMSLVLGAAVLNIALNFALIPGLGLRGAAIATFLSYLALTSSMALAGGRRLRVLMPWRAILQAGVLSLLMFELVTRIHAGGRPGTIAARVVVGAAAYVGALAALDEGVRESMRRGLARLKAGGA